ncbi:hypothetical protein [Wenjunlia tyrosinilytica]|uniref:Uncharacterized protein n=1 Tax=Wenjunlia tyrosinilytica TaxID=1544741 RepID=A0A918DYL8_9ACTN|nr:hypothetical protein [Wenjunlia tyrosinilytica]GGO88365.1 hypothetical protein GCM10012280_29000 [Wenjunlia tyrosinilytica]
MSAKVKRVPRGPVRRMGERMVGLALLAKIVVVVCLVFLVLAGGVWVSWRASEDAMNGDRVRGVLTVSSCSKHVCTGEFMEDGTGRVRRRMRIDESVVGRTGETLRVAVKPGTDSVVRTGPAGVLHAWLPLGGALLLASLVLVGGLGLRRTGWVAGIAGVALMGASFVTL